MKMDIRPYRSEDLPQVTRLMQVIWEDPPTDDARVGPPGARSWIAESEQGAVMGCASVWSNTFHPHARYIAIMVHPSFQRMGLGRTLLEWVEQQGDVSIPLQTRVWESSFASMAFFQRHGFEVIRRTFMPVYKLAGVGLSGRHFAEADCERLSIRVRTLPEYLRTYPQGRAELAALAEECYTATHSANPVAELSSAKWQELAFGDLHVDHSWVAERDGKLVGFTLAHPDADAARLELGWCGVASADLAHEHSIMQALTLNQAERAKDKGFTHVADEIDTTHRWAMLRGSFYPVTPAPTLVTFRRGSSE